MSARRRSLVRDPELIRLKLVTPGKHYRCSLNSEPLFFYLIFYQ